MLNLGTNALTRGNNMNRARWYSSTTTLLNGETYVQGGSGGTDRPEMRGGNGVYRLLSGANTSAFDFMYPRNFVAPDGRVFGYDSAGRMYYINTAGTGTVTTAGQFASATAGNDASAAMFAPGRILQYGGNSNQAIVIDINGATPAISSTSAMLRQRRLSVATLLADGKVVATGGSAVWNQMTNVSYEAEIWNPQTGTWTRRRQHGQAAPVPRQRAAAARCQRAGVRRRSALALRCARQLEPRDLLPAVPVRRRRRRRGASEHRHAHRR